MFSEMFIIQNWIHILTFILQISTPFVTVRTSTFFITNTRNTILAKSKQQVNPLILL